jgi:hypothetical protein
MSEDNHSSTRELVTRVATLELLVADLIDLLWRVDPKAMDTLAGEAARDLELQNSRVIAAAEQHRDRLFSVLQTRRRKLERGRRAVATPG